MSNEKERKESYLLDHDPYNPKIILYKWVCEENTYKPILRFAPWDNSSTVIYSAISKYLEARKKFITEEQNRATFYLNEEDGDTISTFFNYWKGVRNEGDKFLFFEVVQPLLSFSSQDLKKLNAGLAMWKLMRNLESVRPEVMK